MSRHFACTAVLAVLAVSAGALADAYQSFDNLIPAARSVSDPATPTPFANGVWVRNFTVSNGTGRVPPGNPVISSFFDIFLEMSVDGGASFQPVILPQQQLLCSSTFGQQNGQIVSYDTQMLQMNFAGPLPFGTMLRESPTLASSGSFRYEPQASWYMIDSFFDIFLEVSTDGGMTWLPALQATRLVAVGNVIPPPVVIQRSISVMNVWNRTGTRVNDYHIVLRGWDENFVPLILADLDPNGYWGRGTRSVWYDLETGFIHIEWSFPDQYVDPNTPAMFGYTLLNGIRYDVVDAYWTCDGLRVYPGQDDVWQDWIKVNGTLQDVVVNRDVFPLTINRTYGSLQAPVTVADVATTYIYPPDPVKPEPGPIVINPGGTVVWPWLWPGTDPSYFTYYTLNNAQGQPQVEFRNVAVLGPVTQNNPPTVDAEPGKEAYEGALVTLTAAGSDPDGDPLAYTWTQMAGAPVVLSGAATPAASFTAPIVASPADAGLVFKVTVQDGRGGTASDGLNVVIWMMGDVNRDNSVDVVDLLMFVDAFGSFAGDPNYDPRCDFVLDASVDVVDLLTFVENFGRLFE